MGRPMGLGFQTKNGSKPPPPPQKKKKSTPSKQEIKNLDTTSISKIKIKI
jgi:hypothetical protein